MGVTQLDAAASDSRLTKEQVEKVRFALWEYKQGLNDGAAEPFTWRDIREEILRYTGVEIGKDIRAGAESLRKFAEKQTQIKHVGVVADYLQKIRMLSERELYGDSFSVKAPVHLNEFFNADCENAATVSLEELAGSYEAVYEEDGRRFTCQLTLKSSKTGEFLYVDKVRRTKSKSENDPGASTVNPDAATYYEGFALISPEDRLQMFLKDRGTGRTHNYYGIQDIGVYLKRKDKVLCLQRHDYGFVPYTGAQRRNLSAPETWLDHIGAQLTMYRRTS